MLSNAVNAHSRHLVRLGIAGRCCYSPPLQRHQIHRWMHNLLVWNGIAASRDFSFQKLVKESLLNKFKNKRKGCDSPEVEIRKKPKRHLPNNQPDTSRCDPMEVHGHVVKMKTASLTADQVRLRLAQSSTQLSSSSSLTLTSFLPTLIVAAYFSFFLSSICALLIEPSSVSSKTRRRSATNFRSPFQKFSLTLSDIQFADWPSILSKRHMSPDFDQKWGFAGSALLPPV